MILSSSRGAGDMAGDGTTTYRSRRKYMFVLVMMVVKASALVGILQLLLTNLTTSINYIHLTTQGSSSDQPSTEVLRSMALPEGRNSAQFHLKTALLLPRKMILSQQYRPRNSFSGDCVKHARLLWEATKRRIGGHDHRAPTRPGIFQQIVWVNPSSILLSKSHGASWRSQTLAGVLHHFSTTRKLDEELSSIDADMNTKFRSPYLHPSPVVTEVSHDPMFHVDYSGPGTHPPHSH